MSDASLNKPKRWLCLLTPRQWGGGKLRTGAIGFFFARPTACSANAADPQARPYQATNDNHTTNSPAPGPLVA